MIWRPLLGVLAAAALLVAPTCSADDDTLSEPLRVSGAFSTGVDSLASRLGGEISESSVYVEFAGDGVIVNAAGLGNVQVTGTDDTPTSHGFALGPAPVEPDGTMEGQAELTIRTGDEATGSVAGDWSATLATDGSVSGTVVMDSGERFGFVTAPDPVAADLAEALGS